MINTEAIDQLLSCVTNDANCKMKGACFVEQLSFLFCSSSRTAADWIMIRLCATFKFHSSRLKVSSIPRWRSRTDTDRRFSLFYCTIRNRRIGDESLSIRNCDNIREMYFSSQFHSLNVAAERSAGKLSNARVRTAEACTKAQCEAHRVQFSHRAWSEHKFWFLSMATLCRRPANKLLSIYELNRIHNYALIVQLSWQFIEAFDDPMAQICFFPIAHSGFAPHFTHKSFVSFSSFV